VREIMRHELKPPGFKMWLKRVGERKTKHLSFRPKDVNTFKSKNQ